jgi:hAT family C-terminal dimerisation region
MQRHVEHAKDQLHQFYLDNYAKMPTPPPAIQPVVTETSGSPQKVNFTARYKKRPSTLKDELEEFYKLPQEDFDTCDPIQWWSGRHSQFPNLSCLARDETSL